MAQNKRVFMWVPVPHIANLEVPTPPKQTEHERPFLDLGERTGSGRARLAQADYLRKLRLSTAETKPQKNWVFGQKA